MSRKSKRKKQGTRRVILAVLILLLVVMGFNIFRLYQKNQMYAAKKAALENKYQEQVDRKEDLNLYEEFTKTIEFVEQFAREKLGLVFDNEIVFKPEN